jgi:hypothetical protein
MAVELHIFDLPELQFAPPSWWMINNDSKLQTIDDLCKDTMNTSADTLTGALMS